MFTRQPFPRRGDASRVHRQRDLARQVDAARMVQGEGGIMADITGAGAFLTQPRAPVLGLFEIRDQECAWRWEERSSSGWPYHYHYTVGRPILYYRADGSWGIPQGESDSSSSGILDQYIVHPTGYPAEIADDQRLYDAFFPLYSDGDWVWCIADPESGLWAIHDGYEAWLRFELATHLPVGSSAQAYLLRCQTCPAGSSGSSGSSGQCPDAPALADCDVDYQPITQFSFRVYDAVCGHEGHKGQRGYCKFMAESRRFEVISLPTALVRVELAEDLPQWTGTPVAFYRRCWDPSGNAGNGSFDTDCNQQISGFDPMQIGYLGSASEGPTGLVEVFKADNGRVGVLRDLRCPISCVCGDQGPAASCTSSSSSGS